jgi:DNA-binding PadR family transcriptional regulator
MRKRPCISPGELRKARDELIEMGLLGFRDEFYPKTGKVERVYFLTDLGREYNRRQPEDEDDSEATVTKHPSLH